MKKYRISAKAKKLLLKVKTRILEEPKRLRMSEWIRIKAMDATAEEDTMCDGCGKEGRSEEIQYPACNTVGCIAGWMDLLANGMPETATQAILRRDNAMEFANDVLFANQSDYRCDLSEKLFYPDWWKPKFRARYEKAVRAKTRATIVAEVIDDFIADHS